jgi:hypothetical protein
MRRVGTSWGISAWIVGSSVARTAPMTKTAANSTPAVTRPARLASASAAMKAASTPTESRRIRRRS